MSKAEEVRELADEVYRASFLSGRTMCLDKATAALRDYADLLEEREREERLLRFHCIPSIRMSNSQGLLYRWTRGKKWGADWVEHPDRATAAKLAEEKMNGPA